MLEENIMTVRQAIEISNTGDTSRVDEVISPDYFGHESLPLIASNLNKPPKAANHSIFPLANFAISSLGVTKYTLFMNISFPNCRHKST